MLHFRDTFFDVRFLLYPAWTEVIKNDESALSFTDYKHRTLLAIFSKFADKYYKYIPWTDYQAYQCKSLIT